MNVLALDTSSRFASLAVLDGDALLLEYNFSSADDISALLVPSLQFLLKSLKMTLDDIGLFGVGIGPGLFTGIRVGLSVVKGILLENPKPLVPVVTLRALAYKMSESKKTIVPLIDARRGEVYAAAYRFEDQQIVEIIQPMLARVEELPGRLTGCQEPVFVGSGAENHRDELKKHFPQSPIYCRSHFLASEIGRIAQSEFRQGRHVLDPEQLLPLYIRRPDAEVKPRKKAAGGRGGGNSHPQD